MSMQVGGCDQSIHLEQENFIQNIVPQHDANLPKITLGNYKKIENKAEQGYFIVFYILFHLLF